MAARWEKTALETLLALLVLGYLGINVVAPIPRPIVVENIVFALLYAALLWGVHRGSRKALLALMVVGAFNAGRVSNSVWDPLTGVAPLALQHLPLLIVILAATLLPLRLLGEQPQRMEA